MLHLSEHMAATLKRRIPVCAMSLISVCIAALVTSYAQDLQAGALITSDFTQWQSGEDETSAGGGRWYCNATLAADGYGVLTDWELFIGQTTLVSFNPQTGEMLGEVIASDSWDYNAIELNPEGTELWLADAAMTNPGIRIFDIETDQELTESPIDVGLPPFAICFVE